MILSDQEIDKRARMDDEKQKDNALIKPYDREKLQAVSYDISIGESIQVFQKSENAINLLDQTMFASPCKETDIVGGYRLLPGEYVLAKTKEYFQMPADLAAHIRPRTSYTRMGLMLSDQHVNPTFHGHLYLGLLNTTPNIIYLFPDMVIGQIVFEAIQGTVSKDALYMNKPDAQYQGECDFRPVRLDEQMQAAKKDRESVERMVDQLLGE